MQKAHFDLAQGFTGATGTTTPATSICHIKVVYTEFDGGRRGTTRDDEG